MPPESQGEGSWPDQATDLIVSTVAMVRDKTVGPAMTIARGIVYGFFAGLIGLCAVVLATIFLIRIITVYTGGRVWIPQIGLGLVFGIVALLLWSKANKIPHR